MQLTVVSHVSSSQLLVSTKLSPVQTQRGDFKCLYIATIRFEVITAFTGVTAECLNTVSTANEPFMLTHLN